MTLNQLTALIVGWAQDRNLIEGSNYRAQCIKLGEELGELAQAGEMEDELEMRDAIGDLYVVATIMAVQLGGSIVLARENCGPALPSSTVAAFGDVCAAVARGREADAHMALGYFINILEAEAGLESNGAFDLTECVTGAWDTIKDRKGRMVDGVFIKDGEA